MQTLKLTIPIPPSINNDYMKPRPFIAHGKPMVTMYETKEAKDFKKKTVKLIKEEISKQDFNIPEHYFIHVDFTFYFPRTNMDTNNYYKTFIDAVTECGLIWKDDNISMIRDKRIYYDSKNPRVEVEIYPSSHIGIFDSQESVERFVSSFCSKCKKGNKIGQKGGCSVYKNAMESRIQDEILIDLENDKIECLVIKSV